MFTTLGAFHYNSALSLPQFAMTHQGGCHSCKGNIALTLEMTDLNAVYILYYEYA